MFNYFMCHRRCDGNPDLWQRQIGDMLFWMLKASWVIMALSTSMTSLWKHSACVVRYAKMALSGFTLVVIDVLDNNWNSTLLRMLYLLFGTSHLEGLFLVRQINTHSHFNRWTTKVWDESADGWPILIVFPWPPSILVAIKSQAIDCDHFLISTLFLSDLPSIKPMSKSKTSSSCNWSSPRGAYILRVGTECDQFPWSLISLYSSDSSSGFRHTKHVGVTKADRHRFIWRGFQAGLFISSLVVSKCLDVQTTRLFFFWNWQLENLHVFSILAFELESRSFWANE